MADRPKGFGMTAELADKKAAKYDPNIEAEIRVWMEAIIGEPFPASDEPEGPDSVHQSLKDGQYLCKLANKLIDDLGLDGASIKYNESKMAFKMMENIGKFLAFCVAQGCVKTDLFQTVDLYEAQNMPQVLNGIQTLGRKMTSIAAAKGNDEFPPIGPKEADKNVREFTEEQKQAGKGVIGLQMGTNMGASQSGMSFGAQRQIH